MSLEQIKKMFEKDPNMSKIPYQIKLVKKGGLQVRAEAGNHEIYFDEPELMGGKDEYANPIQMLLASIGSCVLISTTIFSKFLEIQINSIEVLVRGRLDFRGMLGFDENVPKGFQEININVKIDSDAPPEKLKELINLASTSCPVYYTIKNTTDIQLKISS